MKYTDPDGKTLETAKKTVADLSGSIRYLRRDVTKKMAKGGGTEIGFRATRRNGKAVRVGKIETGAGMGMKRKLMYGKKWKGERTATSHTHPAKKGQDMISSRDVDTLINQGKTIKKGKEGSLSIVVTDKNLYVVELVDKKQANKYRKSLAGPYRKGDKAFEGEFINRGGDEKGANQNQIMEDLITGKGTKFEGKTGLKLYKATGKIGNLKWEEVK